VPNISLFAKAMSLSEGISPAPILSSSSSLNQKVSI